MRDFRIRNGSAALAVSQGGTGAPLVFLHAGVADRRMWRAQLAAFAPTHTVLAYDRRGFGETTCAEEPHRALDDLIAVLDACDVRAATLVGCSQGGRIAVDAALAHPERVSALMLVAPAVSGAPWPKSHAPPVQALFDALAAAEGAGDLARANAIEAQLWLDGPAEREGRVGGAARELFLDMNGIALRSAPTGVSWTSGDAYHRLPEISAPTLVACGDRDLMTLRELCRDVASRVANGRHCELAGAAHLPSLEIPDVFNSTLRDFLAALAAPPSTSST